MARICEHIHVMGCGLIGSSIVRAVRAKDLAARVTTSDINDDVISRVNKLGIADGASADLAEFTDEADMIILATPPGKMAAAASTVMPGLKPGAILSDVGSIKSDIIKQITPLLRDDIEFVPAHPIAGTENSGPEAGFASLFEKRWCILTPTEPQSDAVKRVQSLWQGMGSDVAIMDAARHDLVLATTSHVPHLIAYTLVGTAIDMETVTQKEVVKFSAGGFRDFTRIAASDPVMWRDVFMQNKDAVLEIVDRFIEDLSAIKRSIRWDEGDILLEQFTRTRDIRRRIIDAGQDSDIANFGRDEPPG